MHTKLLTQVRLLHPFLPMKPRTLPLLSRAFFFPPSKFLRPVPFKARAFSARAHAHSRDKLPVRPSKSLVDDEADLSDWVDELRTGRANRFAQRFSSDDDEDRESRPPRRNNNRASTNLGKRRGEDLPTGRVNRLAQRFSSDEDENREFRPPRRNDNRASTNLGKRRGEDLRRGRQNASARRKFQPRSDDDEEVVESGRKFKGGGVGAFLSEDESEDEDEESDGSEEEEILNKSRTALFGQQNGLNRKTIEPTTRPSSPGGSDSYLSESRCVHYTINVYVMLLRVVLEYV